MASYNYPPSSGSGSQLVGGALTDGDILVGDASNQAAAVTPSGEATISNTGVVTLDNDSVIGKTLTDFTPGAGTVTDADTILTALQKIDANTLANPLTSDLVAGAFNIEFSGGNSIWSVYPTGSADEVNIQAAIDACNTAGGGIVKLATGTFVIEDVITIPAEGNNIILEGSGKDTVLDGQVPASGGLPQYIIDWNISPPSAAKDKVLNATTKNATSVTFTTASDAANYLEGDYIVISGTDAFSEKWREINEVAADGDGGTGIVTLRSPLAYTLSTSVTASAFRYGRNNQIRDMAFIHTSGASHAIRAAGMWDFKLTNCWFDGTGFSENYCLDLSLYRSLVSGNNLQNYDRPETGSIGWGVAFAGSQSKFINNTLLNCGTASKTNRAGIEIKDAYNMIIDNNDIINSQGDGIRATNSSVQRSIQITNNRIVGSKDNGIAISDPASNTDFIIEGNQCRSNGADGSGNGIYTTAKRIAISNNVSELNTDEGINIAGGSRIAISGNVVRKNTDGITLQSSATDLTVSGNTTVDNTAANIYVGSTTNCSIVGNMITGGPRGIRSVGSSSGILISGNSCRGHSTANILMSASDSNYTITGNDFGGTLVTYSTGTGHLISNNRDT
ncbi:MAG: right-handed parallel beta-helix repeat-containing protein [Flavobacteriales bacterium]|nr:right-handed parallel beta-helix repeat-containing protein [Flavobacteriales bacterium]